MLSRSRSIAGAILYTIRPSASLGACLLVLAAYQPNQDEWQRATLLVLCTFFGSAFCFIINDIYDREKDLLNQKHRPIATGIIPIATAYTFCTVSALGFAILACFFGLKVFLLSILFLAIVGLYSWLNVKSGLLANMIVAGIVAGTQWGVSIIKPDPFLTATAAFLFLFTIARELLLDWLDRKGDDQFGKRSIAISASALQFKFALIILVICASTMLLLLILKMELSLICSLFLLTTVITTIGSYLTFWRTPTHATALLGVRLSHLPFACLIVALLLR